ncbi:MAG: chemotaxis protein CheX [Halarcobacter sp.]
MSLSLNEDQVDCLQELMNIAYGSATASLAEIIGKNAKLGIPNIKTFNSQEFQNYCDKKFDDHGCYLVNQKIDGTLSGENLFIMDKKSTTNLAKEFGLSDEEITDSELRDIVLEITNIISSTTLSKLASLMDASIIFSPPSIKKIESILNFSDKYKTQYKFIIVISTEIIFEQQNIYGELIIMSKDESVFYMKNALDRLLKEF